MLTSAALFSRLALVLVLSATINHPATAESNNEAALKTAFLFNFFKFIEWPDAAASTYSLCTTDNDRLGDSLLVLENKTIGGKPISVRRGISGQDLKTCQLVFIGATENTAKIIHDLKGLPIVIVSDKANFIEQGGTIGLVQRDNRLGFEVNLGVANANDIHISAQMLKLAKRVATE